jgi:2-amino-4-hydroxy-6-hydroxymethyldihydropteridine diphosphokinase
MILIALGANLPSQAGPPAATLAGALKMLASMGATPLAVSGFYASEAWPDPSDPPFVNAVARVDTKRDPAGLMMMLEVVENTFGRVRCTRNAPRTLDLDLIDYDGLIQGGPPSLPHPRMERRGFVLVPLADVAPEWRHPISGRMVDELIGALPEGEQSLVCIDQPRHGSR